MDKKIDALKQTPQKTSTDPPHTHSANVDFSCPDCQKAYDAEVTAKALSAQTEKIKNMYYPEVCEDCGEVFDAEKKDECPTCHGDAED